MWWNKSAQDSKYKLIIDKMSKKIDAILKI